jgi:hypothetical protein
MSEAMPEGWTERARFLVSVPEGYDRECLEELLEGVVDLSIREMPSVSAEAEQGDDEILRIVKDQDGYTIMLPGDGQWASSGDPRLLGSYVSLRLGEVASEAELPAVPPQMPVRVEQGDGWTEEWRVVWSDKLTPTSCSESAWSGSPDFMEWVRECYAPDRIARFERRIVGPPSPAVAEAQDERTER